MSQESLLIKLGVDVSELQKGFDSASEKVKHLTESLEAIGSALAFEKLVEGFKELVQESADADLGIRKFYNGMKAGGQSLDLGLFDEFAESFEKITGANKDATFAAATALTRFHATQDQIEAILPAAADLSASLGISLADAAERMGQATVTGGRGLMSLGLGFDHQAKQAFEAADQNQRFAMLLDRVGETVKGTAELINGSAVGSLNQYGNATKELKEALGGIIESPFSAVVQRMTSAVIAVTAAFNNLSPGVKEFLGDFAIAVASVGGVASGLAALTAVIGAVAAAAPVVGSALLGALTTAAEALAPVALGFAAIVLVIGIVRTAVDTLREAWSANMDDIQGKVKGVIDYVKDLYDQFMKLTGLAWALQKIKELLPGGTKVVGEVASGLMAGATAVKNVLSTGADGVVTAFKSGLGTIGDLLDGVFTHGAAEVKSAFPNLAFKPAGATAAAAPAAAPLKGFSIQQLAAGDPLADEVRQKAEAAGAAFTAAFGYGEEAQKRASEFLQSLQSETGLSANSLSLITEHMGGSAQDVADLSAHLHDMSDEAVKNLLEIPGITKEGVEQIADEMRTIPQIIKNAAAQAKGVIDSGGGVGPDGNPGGDALSGLSKGLGLATTQQPMGAETRFASNVAGKLGGDYGTTIQAGIQGGAAGGPVGAAAAAGLDLLTKTKSFSKLTGALGMCMSELTGALEPLVQVLAIVLTALKPLFQVVGTVLSVVMKGLLKYFEGMAWIYNKIVDVINKLLGWAGVHVDKIDVKAIEDPGQSAVETSSANAASSLNGVATAADNASNSLSNATQGFKASWYVYQAANDDRTEANQQVKKALDSGQLERIGRAATLAVPMAATGKASARGSMIPTTTFAGNPAPVAAKPVLASNVNINVQTSDPVVLSRKLRDQMESDNFRTGQVAQSSGNPYAAARTV